MNCRPKYLPGKYLKGKWNRWNAGRSYGQVPNATSPNHETDTAYHGAGEGGGSEMNTTDNTPGVRRETSTRSTITLPPYSASPKPEEQIIAREGERGGMDVVVEFPETAEEEETRRDELMETLYQIRVQRRQENAERDARRQARRDARARGDFIRLEELRSQSSVQGRGRSSSARASASASASASNPNLSASALLAEHQSRGRERRIASVNYAALGRVRHDGSRLRHNSNDSDNRPLLQNAASIHEDRSGNPISHYRGESYSSLVSGSSVTSDGDTLTPVASQRPSLHSARSRSDSRPTSIPEEENPGAEEVSTVPPPPPEYDHLEWGQVPAYTNPIAERLDSSVRDERSANGESTQSGAANNATTAATTTATTTPASGHGVETHEHGSQGEQEERPQNNEETHQGIQRSQPPAPLPLLTPLPAIQIDVASPISDLTPTTPTQPQSREQAPEHPAEDTHQQHA